MYWHTDGCSGDECCDGVGTPMVVVVVSVVFCWCWHTDGCSSGECCVGVGTPMIVYSGGECCVGIGTPMVLVVMSVVLVLAHRWL